MSDNGSIVLEGLIISGGGSGGGGTAATTSFEPTATITSKNVQAAIEEVDSSLSDITQDIAAISGLGGYINSYDFGTATPTQQALTDYALTQIPNITASDVFNGTRVKNLFDNHIWILTNTPNTVPPVFAWADNGYDTVGIASNTVAGLVKGSATNGGLTVASDGTASVTGFNTKYDKTGGTLTGNVIINRGTASSAISLVGSGAYQVVEGTASSLYLYKSDNFNDRLTSVSTAGKVKWYVYKEGVAKELGLTDASEISYSGTLSSTTVKNAIEEVDAKAIAADAAAEAVAGDLADTVINGVAIAGKNNTCDDLGLQCKLQESATVSLKTTNVVSQKLLLKFTTADGFQDISLNPLTFSFSGSPVYGDPLYSNSTNQSLRLLPYDTFHVNKPGGADWSKINVGTGPFTIKFRRKCSSAAYSGDGKLAPVNFTASLHNTLYLDGRISLSPIATPAIAITENAIEELLLTRLDNGSFKYYKDGTELGTSEVLNGVALDFSDWGYGFVRGPYGTEDYVSGFSISNKAYTGGNYTPSEDYPTQESCTVIQEAAVIIPVGYRQIASKTCTGTAETSLIDDTGAKGTNVIPADTLQVGDVIMLDIEGDASGLSAATATLNIKYGSTVIATLDKPFTDTYTGIHFDVKATATVRAIGATGKLVLSGLVYLRNRTVQGSGITWPIGGTSEITIDTTAESALDATIAWSAENAGNTITASQFVISSLLR